MFILCEVTCDSEYGSMSNPKEHLPIPIRVHSNLQTLLDEWNKKWEIRKCERKRPVQQWSTFAYRGESRRTDNWAIWDSCYPPYCLDVWFENSHAIYPIREDGSIDLENPAQPAVVDPIHFFFENTGVRYENKDDATYGRNPTYFSIEKPKEDDSDTI